METTHAVAVGDARDVDLADDSVELVVTSPPYPMIEMWDETFAAMDPAVETALAAGDGRRAFEAMHAVLDEVWAEVARVLVEGGIACVNVGDATRTLDGDDSPGLDTDGSAGRDGDGNPGLDGDETGIPEDDGRRTGHGRFRVYPNHARILTAFESLGFDPLPDVLWRKPANSAAKFMGSGMLPPNAYVTLEHEYVLVFRNGERRSFEPGADRRYEASYFWEERNRWFSDVWTDVTGERQGLGEPADDLRERSAAFPFEVPHRLVNMYSVYGDTVLDPFWGTGTTSLAALVAGRNSVGCELDAEFVDVFADRVADAPALSRSVVRERFDRHREFVRETRANGGELGYRAEHYDVPVRTKQERRMRFYAVDDVRSTAEGYRARHSPVEEPPTR